MKPHAVCVPFPAQGHVNPMIKFAKLLHHNGFHITFVNTESNHRLMLKSRGPESLTGIPSFNFKMIPDGLPRPDKGDALQFDPSICDSIGMRCLPPLKDLLEDLNNTCNSNVPRVSCIISDAFMSFTLEATEELGIPNVFLCCTNASAYMGAIHFRKLIDMGIVPLKDEIELTNGYLDQVIDWIPGMKGIRLRDLPTFVRTTNAHDNLLNYIIREMDMARKASAIVMNTFEKLEPNVIVELSSFLPPIYPIGPLHLLEDHVADDRLNFIGSNLWKEDPGCVEWLDSMEPNSVLYVNFGSITLMSQEHLLELAWGLANSKHPFLWIIRPNLVAGGQAILPEEFFEETKGRGLLASWCGQEKVLAHGSIGGFLTHSGWNSTAESISCGVPMICCPFAVDQMTNSYYCCSHWGIGIEISNDVKREEVKSAVEELMSGVNGQDKKKKAMHWKNFAEEAATMAGGSSSINLMKLIYQLLLP